jgi:uncharacterized membrane protein YgcG
MNTMRYESRAGRAAAHIDPRLPKLAVAMIAVFLFYFVIGRVADTRSSRAGATSSRSTLFHSGATPIALGAAPPIASVVNTRRPIDRKREASAIRATSARKQPIARAVSTAPLRSSRQEQPVPEPPAKAPSPPVSAPRTSAPPASTPPASVPAPSTGGSSSGGGGHSGSSQGGGGSFDSSG